MNFWIGFWLVTISVSLFLFVGVAVLIAVKGWKDLRQMMAGLSESTREGDDTKP